MIVVTTTISHQSCEKSRIPMSPPSAGALQPSSQRRSSKGIQPRTSKAQGRRSSSHAWRRSRFGFFGGFPLEDPQHGLIYRGTAQKKILDRFKNSWYSL